MSKLKIPSDQRLAYLQSYADHVVPHGWKVKVQRHPSGEGVHGIVYQAPVDLLQDLRDHGIPIDGMHFPANMHVYTNYLDATNVAVMKDLWLALNDGNPPLSVPGHYYVALDIGSPKKPFHHVLLEVLDAPKPKKAKKLHPAVQAYADHAKAMGALIASHKAQEAEADRKKLFPPGSMKYAKAAKANYTWG
jgi:hypothetical protein